MTTALSAVAEQLADRYLVPYVDRLRKQGAALHPKQIHDSVWGTVSLTPLEVAILDSPLLQRLRHLRQLGVAHWVYPSAGHSRFEHSLGVLHQTQQIINAINQSSLTRYNREAISSEQQILLRCAALLHDVGHPVLSHVSEYAIKLDPPTLLALVRERKKVGEDAKLSEIVAAMVVRSDAFKELLSVVASFHARAGLPSAGVVSRADEFVNQVANCILGKSISQEMPLLHEIISGPFDADKLDYMVRDAKMAGIPGIIDISRLVQKVTVTKLATRELPERIARVTPRSVPEVLLTGFPWSGLSVVDELLLTKMILFSKLYQHPKVVAAEAMVQVLVERLWEVCGTQRLMQFLYDVLDEELILCDRDSLMRRLGVVADDLDAHQQYCIDQAIDIIERLRERRLFVRAFAFSAHNPNAQDGGGDAGETPFVQLVRRLSEDRSLGEFRGRIVRQLQEIIALLNPPELEQFSDASVYVAIKKKHLPSQEELRRAYIFPSHGKPKTFGDTGIHKDAWSSSFVSAMPKGYIFTPKELAPYIFIATEAAIAEEFNVAIPDWLMEEAKQTADVVRPIKMKLREAGYYKGKPRAIRPVGERLQMADAEQVVDEFADRFSVVQETVRNYAKELPLPSGAGGMRHHALEWLDQFDDELIECALDVLMRAKVLGRKEVVGAFENFLSKFPAYRGASVVGLSAGSESSQIVQYYLADVAADLKFFPSMHEATNAGRDGPVLFVDDFCGSGGQVKNILGSWFDDADLKKPDLNEQRQLALDDHKAFLSQRPLAFFFVAGRSAGLGEVRAALAKLKLNGSVYAEIVDDDIPTAFAPTSDRVDQAVWAAFKLRCEEIGRELLSKEKWPKRKVEERILGYGNEALLLFFPYNSPAQSLTCMWASGDVAGDPWSPLIARRKKVIN